ncbi:unnamed protein product [Linum trigynum]|uniref:Uncharacterized protein n=1 Tax=Linum trigynum TaxID=586398 RepID=A0AAV2CYJ0_9ROSI
MKEEQGVAISPTLSKDSLCIKEPSFEVNGPLQDPLTSSLQESAQTLENKNLEEVRAENEEFTIYKDTLSQKMEDDIPEVGDHEENFKILIKIHHRVESNLNRLFDEDPFAAFLESHEAVPSYLIQIGEYMSSSLYSYLYHMHNIQKSKWIFFLWH